MGIPALFHLGSYPEAPGPSAFSVDGGYAATPWETPLRRGRGCPATSGPMRCFADRGAAGRRFSRDDRKVKTYMYVLKLKLKKFYLLIMMVDGTSLDHLSPL